MPLPIYVKFDGIDGSCQVQGRENTVQVLALDHLVHIPVDVKDASATGARQHGAMTMTANVDKAFPNLMKSCCTSQAIKTVTADFYQIDDQGQQKKYFTIKLENARVTDIKTWIPNVDDAATSTYKHMADYGLRYEKITWTIHDGNIEFSDEWKKPAS
ncbi:MAG: type VI secretion system tube protein Hcp [Deltaproteobacteria bacterium]|nr:type VI secretion system tube protein Hcp [Deltaproteobacteria bacterium]